jgi:lipopolysaccharide transport system permease protein
VVLPVIMAVQFAFTLGLGFLFAGINAAFRDTQHLILVFLQLYMFLTPIFYDLGSIPERYRPFFALNPMMHIVEGYRAALMHGTIPDLVPFVFVTAFALCTIAVGMRVYGWARYRYLEEL